VADSSAELRAFRRRVDHYSAMDSPMKKAATPSMRFNPRVALRSDF